MKGAVFIALNEMIENQYGIEVWEELLDEVNPQCGGVYTSVEDYPDEEIVAFVLAISAKLNLDTSLVTRIFGTHLFGELNSKYPVFTQTSENLFSFLESVENVIHKEVRKLFESANLPSIDTKISDNYLDLTYSSPRKLCYLAEGLIFGAADYYSEKIQIDHTVCMHQGSDRCRIRITKNE